MKPLAYVEITPGPDARAHQVFADLHRAVHFGIVEQGPLLAVDYPTAKLSQVDELRVIRNGHIGTLMRVFAPDASTLATWLGRNDVLVLRDTDYARISDIREAPEGANAVEWKRSRDRDHAFSPSRARREAARGRAVPRLRLRESVGLALYSASTRQHMSLQMYCRAVEGAPQLGVPNSYGLSSGSTWLPRF